MSVSAIAEEENKEMSRALYHVLTMSTKDRALKIIQGTEFGSGYLAWRKLRKEMQPKCQERYLGMLQQIMQLRFNEESRILEVLQDWERMLQQYEAQSEDTVSDQVKKAILVMACPENIKSCLLYTSPSPRDQRGSRMPSSA